MGLETGTYLEDLVPTNPVGATDPKSQGDNHLRLIKSVLKATFPGLAGSAFRVQVKSANYTLAATDNMSVILCTSGMILTLPDAGVLGNKHMCIVVAQGVGVVLDPTGADLVNGAAAYTLSFNQAAMLVCDGDASYYAIVLGGPGGSGSTGDVKASVRTTAEPGWVLAAGTIGNAASGATTRANADTQALFTVLWAWADAQAPVLPGGRGASASADFAANKTIALPDLRGRVIAGLDNMGGSNAGRLDASFTATALGATGGSETHSHGGTAAGTAATTGISGTAATNGLGTSGPNVAVGRGDQGGAIQVATNDHTHTSGADAPVTINEDADVSVTIASDVHIQHTMVMNIFIKL